MIFAYADETEFTLTKNHSNTVIGSGIFITSREITQDLINKALYELDKDPDKNEQDLKTLSNGFFHASFDSKNAHSHLCTMINDNLKGCFRYSYFDKSKTKPWEKIKTQEEINRLTLGLSSLDFYNSNDKVQLIIEGRGGFSQEQAENFINNWQNQLDCNIYNQPSFITYYPDIKVSVMDKNNPGLQVVDFLLWVFNRASMKKPDNVWKERLKFKHYSSHTVQDSPDSGGDFYLNESLNVNGRLNYPFKVEEPEKIEDFYQSYVTIEQTLRQLTKIEFPNHAKHLRSKLNKLESGVFSKMTTINDKLLYEIASLFIRLFDTFPIYDSIDDTDKESWDLILKAKKMAGLFLRRDLIHGVRSSMAIIRWRNEVIKSRPEILTAPNSRS